jgi:hypothetical protein
MGPILHIVAALAEASGGALRLFPAYPSGLDAKLSFPAAESSCGHRTEWTGRPVPPSRRSSP